MVSADLPVECLRTHLHDQVWNFYVSQEHEEVNLFETKEICTHKLPNKMQVLAHGQKFHFGEKADLYQILIKPDFTAEASVCPNGNDKSCNKEKLKGDW